MLALGVAGLLFPHNASAVSSNPKTFISGDNTFYAYAKGGETVSASFIKSPIPDPGGLPPQDITVTLEGPGLPAQSCVLPKAITAGQGCGFAGVTAPQSGIYRVSFSLPPSAEPYDQVSSKVKWGGNLFNWNVTVKDGGTERPGRVWTEIYAIRQPVPDSYLADMTFYYVSESGYLYRGAYKGYNGQVSTFSADAVGIRKNTTCDSSYASIDSSDSNRSPSYGDCGGSYKLYFEQPSGDLPQSAKRWDDTTDWVSPAVTRPIVKNLRFETDKDGSAQSGKIKFNLGNFVGQYKVQIDTYNDGSFDSDQDIQVKRTLKKLDNSEQTVNFNGIDGRGQVIPTNQAIAVRIQVDKTAEIHLVNADVEGRVGGLELVRLNGDNAPTTRMCWNDTGLAGLADATFQTPLTDGRSCPDSTGGVHGWRYATGSWGDNRYIDDWAYAAAKVDGTTAIVYEGDTAVAAMGNQKTIPLFVLIIFGIVLLIVFAVLTTVAISKRKARKRAMAQAAEQARLAQQQQPPVLYSDGPPPPTYQ